MYVSFVIDYSTRMIILNSKSPQFYMILLFCVLCSSFSYLVLMQDIQFVGWSWVTFKCHLAVIKKHYKIFKGDNSIYRKLFCIF